MGVNGLFRGKLLGINIRLIDTNHPLFWPQLDGCEED